MALELGITQHLIPGPPLFFACSLEKLSESLCIYTLAGCRHHVGGPWWMMLWDCYMAHPLVLCVMSCLSLFTRTLGGK